MRIKNYMSIVILSLTWFVTFGVLAWSANNTTQWVGLSILALISGFCVISWLNFLKTHRRQDSNLKLLQGAVLSFAPYEELVIFDADGKTVWTTHPNSYPNQTEFLRKLLLRVNPSEQSEQLRDLIENKKRGNILLMGGGDGLGQQQKWWLVRVMPVDSPFLFEQNHLTVVVHDLSQYLENYTQLKHMYNSLENFIDQAPFGILYTSRNGMVIGTNDTFAQWVDMDKNQILGKMVKDFIPDQAHHNVGIVTIQSDRASSFKALAFFPRNTVKGQGQNSRAHSLILCRLDAFASETLSDPKLRNLDLTHSPAPIPATILNQDLHIVNCNPAFATMICEEVAEDRLYPQPGNSFIDLIHPAARSEVNTKLRRAFENETAPIPFEIRFKGDKVSTTAYVRQIFGPNGHELMPRIIIQFIDISEQKRLERQFIQSQKMQAVGQLAGGIAHDFNNLLTAIIGFCDLLLQRYMPQDPSYTDLMQIKQNANRAANLVRQLLAFSRQQALQPKIINMTDALSELSALLQRLIGAGIDLKIIHSRDLWYVKVDIVQLEQVIINLSVNARDAMENGGRLSIKTSNYVLPKQKRAGHDLIPSGEYVLLEVSDTGHGIASEHLEHIFEPFFSTKEVGAGTGLGLSTVYGIVKQTGGFVQVESNMGQGTTFKIYFPRYIGDEKEIAQENVVPIPEDLTGGGTILLVEDEDAVRVFSSRALREKGYKVYEASSGDEALEILQKGIQLDLLITDVVMPKMDGPTLCKKIQEFLPDLKTIFISGYTEDTFRKNLGHNTKIHFLPKPFTLKDLASKVKEVISLNRKFPDHLNEMGHASSTLAISDNFDDLNIDEAQKKVVIH